MLKIKKLRIEKGLRQQDLANMLEKKRTTISMYENGVIKPPYEIILKLKKILDYYEDDILTIVNEKTKIKRIYKKRNENK